MSPICNLQSAGEKTEKRGKENAAALPPSVFERRQGKAKEGRKEGALPVLPLTRKDPFLHSLLSPWEEGEEKGYSVELTLVVPTHLCK